MKTDILFLKKQEDAFNFQDKDLIELKAYGLSLNNSPTRPFLILKDESGDHSLAVGISQVDAAVTLAQNNTQSLLSSPHSFLKKMLDSFNVQVEKCVFMEINGAHQFVRLFLIGHPSYHSIKIRADEAMSLCLYLKTPFFATKEFIHRSKEALSAFKETPANEWLDPVISKKTFYH